MPVFLTVVMLGLGFFLSCLLAIHVDERRRRTLPVQGRRLTPLAEIPKTARKRPYRRVITLPVQRATGSTQLGLQRSGKLAELGSTRQRAAGSSQFRKLSRGGE